MPGIDTDLEGLGLDELPARLARLLLDATAQVERRAGEANASPDATVRSVGVIARTGAALAALVERLARLRALQAAGLGETEEADMDDAEDAGAHGAEDDAADIERGLRDLARNLRIGGAAEDGGDGAAAGGAEAGAELVGADRAQVPAAA